MYYRITKVNHEAGMRDEMRDILEAKADVLKSFEGLHWVKMIAVSDTVTMAISEYGSEDQLRAVEGRFREVMVDLAPLMAGPPEVSTGDEFWLHSNV